jgi:hypothetical protein
MWSNHTRDLETSGGLSSDDERLVRRVGVVLRLIWIVVQFILVYWLGETGAPFFYQAF